MRSLTFQELQTILNDNNIKYNDKQIFIESGTYKGGTIFPISKYFKTVHTIEINKNAYEYCINLANKQNIKNINFHLGDTIDILPNIISSFKDNEFTIFFLDGHVTQNNTEFTGKGKIDVPLLDELNIIYNKFNGEGIIIIDDTRLLNQLSSKNTAYADWSNISLNSILNNFKTDRIIKYYFTFGGGIQKENNDRLIIYFKKNNNIIYNV